MAYQLYQVRSGKTGRVVAKTRKLATARKRAAGLLRRGSKRVSIMRGGKVFSLTASAPRRRGRHSSKRRSSNRHATKRRTSKRTRRSSKRRSSKR
jgi:hypothetical protein